MERPATLRNLNYSATTKVYFVTEHRSAAPLVQIRQRHSIRRIQADFNLVQAQRKDAHHLAATVSAQKYSRQANPRRAGSR